MFISTAYALTTTSTNTSNNALFTSQMDFWDFVLFAISAIVLFAWVFSIMYILWWGVLLILSWGKDDKIKPAINSIRYALIWLWVIVLSIFVFPKIAGLLWLDVTKYSEPDKIFSQIKTLWDKIFKSSGGSSVDLDLKSDSPNIWDDFSDL